MRKTPLFLSAAALIALLAGPAGCEDDGGAPGWNAGLTDAGAAVDAAAPRDSQPAGRDGPAGGDAVARDATGF